MYTQTEVCQAEWEGIVGGRLLIVECTLIADHTLVSIPVFSLCLLVRHQRDIISFILFLIAHHLKVESDVMIANAFQHLRCYRTLYFRHLINYNFRRSRKQKILFFFKVQDSIDWSSNRSEFGHRLSSWGAQRLAFRE
jgi:hypothetical protein